MPQTTFSSQKCYLSHLVSKVLLNYFKLSFVNEITLSVSEPAVKLNVKQVKSALQHFASEPAIHLSLPFVRN